MLVIPGRYGKDTCDGFSRRELLRVGGTSLAGLTLPALLKSERADAAEETQRYGGPGFGKAKHVILVYLQGGPSHLDLWDPKRDVPDNVKSVFNPISTKLPGVEFTENLPKLAQVIDKTTLLRAVSYTPVGLFNHTAAIYQIITGYTADKVSPSGQLEQPSPKDFPNYGCHIIKAKPGHVLAWGGERRLSGALRSGSSPTHFATLVHHPGNKPYPYLIPGAKRALQKAGVLDGVVKRWNEAA